MPLEPREGWASEERMAVKSDSRAETEELLKRILYLSRRVGISAPAMKPFVRFSPCAKERAFGTVSYARFFWDFDDLIQKKLLGLLVALASPDTIVRLCIEQWKDNLAGLYDNQREALEQAVCDGAEYPFHFDDRTEFVSETMRPGGRLLYVGCGAGRQCFSFARKGLDVVGIDTMALLLDVARGWAAHLDLPVHLACMDVMNLGFEPGSFDGFLLEFYGSLPSLSQVLALQRGLAKLLHSGGQGFVVAARKKYASCWFRAGSPYPPAMSSWLIPHARADFVFSGADSCEERLLDGLYNRSHTVESLSSELSRTFEVTECFYERDPRYVIAVVKPKSDTFQGKSGSRAFRRPDPAEASTPASSLNGIGPERELELHLEAESDDVSARGTSSISVYEVNDALNKIESLCDQLESHTERVVMCFSDPGVRATGECLEAISSELSGFLDQLADAMM